MISHMRTVFVLTMTHIQMKLQLSSDSSTTFEADESLYDLDDMPLSERKIEKSGWAIVVIKGLGKNVILTFQMRQVLHWSCFII